MRVRHADFSALVKPAGGRKCCISCVSFTKKTFQRILWPFSRKSTGPPHAAAVPHGEFFILPPGAARDHVAAGARPGRRRRRGRDHRAGACRQAAGSGSSEPGCGKMSTLDTSAARRGRRLLQSFAEQRSDAPNVSEFFGHLGSIGGASHRFGVAPARRASHSPGRRRGSARLATMSRLPGAG
jgi:hypothetical protein